MSLCLTPEEIRDLTAKERPSAQARALDAMGILYRRRPDGTLAVLRAHVQYEQPKEKPHAPALRIPKARRVLAGQT